MRVGAVVKVGTMRGVEGVGVLRRVARDGNGEVYMRSEVGGILRSSEKRTDTGEKVNVRGRA